MKIVCLTGLVILTSYFSCTEEGRKYLINTGRKHWLLQTKENNPWKWDSNSEHWFDSKPEERGFHNSSATKDENFLKGLESAKPWSGDCTTFGTLSIWENGVAHKFRENTPDLVDVPIQWEKVVMKGCGCYVLYEGPERTGRKYHITKPQQHFLPFNPIKSVYKEKCGPPCPDRGAVYKHRVNEQVHKNIPSWEACSDKCRTRSDCKYWTWHSGDRSYNCVTMTGYRRREGNDNMVSGTSQCLDGGSDCMKAGVLYWGKDIKNVPTQSPLQCACECRKLNELVGFKLRLQAKFQILPSSNLCSFYSWNEKTKTCYMKNGIGDRRESVNHVSGTPNCCKARECTKVGVSKCSCIQKGYTYLGNNVKKYRTSSSAKCSCYCRKTFGCSVFNYDRKNKICSLKSTVTGLKGGNLDSFSGGPDCCQEKCKCGIERKRTKRKRIVKGSWVEPGKYPWMVHLVYAPLDPQLSTSAGCGGTLIASKWVVTAAHCCSYYKGKKEKEWIVKIVLGENISADITNKETTGFRKELDHKHEDEFCHPDFTKKKYSNDIALLRLREEVDMLVYTPACLPTKQGRDFYTHKIGYVYGWGYEDACYQGNDFTLKEITMETLTNAECIEKSEQRREYRKTEGVYNDKGELVGANCVNKTGGAYTNDIDETNICAMGEAPCPDINANYNPRVNAKWHDNIRRWEDCSQKCGERQDCKYWTWHHEGAPQQYRLKCVTMGAHNKKIAPKKRDSNTVSGNRDCVAADDVIIGSGTCNGDSGGPLTMKNSRQHELVGVTSTAGDCANDWPGVFVRVNAPKMMEWLKKIMANNDGAKYC